MSSVFARVVLAPFVLARVVACAGDATPPPDDRVSIDSDQDALARTVTSRDEPVDVQPAGAQPNMRVAATDFGYALTLVAEVAPPVVDGVTLQATSIVFQDAVAVVSYNVAGDARKGAVDVFVFDAEENPKLASRATFKDTDINAVGAAHGRVYLATASDDASFEGPAVLEALGLGDDGVLSLQGHFRTGLSSFGVTDVALGDELVYATTGDRGGVYALDANDGSVVAEVGLDDARWLAVPGDGSVVAVRGTPGALVVYGGKELDVAADYPFEGATIPESKATIEVVGGRAYVAAGPAGALVIDLASGKEVARIPVPMIGEPDPDAVTNAVSVDGDLVFVSNGAAGVFLVAASADLAVPAAETEKDLEFKGMGHLIFAGDSGGSVNHITYKDGFLFVATGRGGLKIVRVDKTCVPSAEIPDNDKDDDCDGDIDEVAGGPIGCSDGEREGFVDVAAWPNIAACAGAWTVPGVLSTTREPACKRQGGDDGHVVKGTDCNVADLCAESWHVCEGANDVAWSSPTGCQGADPQGKQFFVVRQSGTGCGLCAMAETTTPGCGDASSCQVGCAQTDALANDLFGCGTLGPAPYGDCGPLDAFSHDNCSQLAAPWACDGGVTEALTVTKPGPEYGGVVCCRDR